MPNDLERRLHVIASTFVTEILRAIGESTLEDVLSEAQPGKRGARTSVAPAPAASKRGRGRPRKDGSTVFDTENVVAQIVRHVTRNPGGTGEATRRALGLTRGTWNPAVRKAVASGQLRKEGEKRSTKYWASGAAG